MLNLFQHIIKLDLANHIQHFDFAQCPNGMTLKHKPIGCFQQENVLWFLTKNVVSQTR